jgi:hypothetical protein
MDEDLINKRWIVDEKKRRIDAKNVLKISTKATFTLAKFAAKPHAKTRSPMCMLLVLPLAP